MIDILLCLAGVGVALSVGAGVILFVCQYNPAKHTTIPRKEETMSEQSKVDADLVAQFVHDVYAKEIEKEVEKRMNDFLQSMRYKDFTWRKDAWAQQKNLIERMVEQNERMITALQKIAYHFGLHQDE